MTFLPASKDLKEGPAPRNGDFSNQHGLQVKVRQSKKVRECCHMNWRMLRFSVLIRRFAHNYNFLSLPIVFAKGNWYVDVYLPPRSVYVMSGSTRLDWKHGVKHNTEANRAPFYDSNNVGTTPYNENPKFFMNHVRRTITLRCTKAFNDEVLARAYRDMTADAPPDIVGGTTADSMNATRRVKQRISAQNKFRPQSGYGEGRINDEEVTGLRVEAARVVSEVHSTFRNIFFTEEERGYVVKNPGNGCWPLFGSPRGAEPSHWIEDFVESFGAAVAVGPTFFGGGGAGIRLGGGYTGNMSNPFAFAAAAASTSTSRKAGGRGDGATSNSFEDVDPQLAEALRLSLESKKEEDRARTRGMARKPHTNTEERSSVPAAPAAHLPTSTSLWTPSSSAATWSGAAITMSKEALRAKRLEKLGGGGSRSDNPPLDGNGKNSANDDNADSNKKRKHRQPTTIDLLDNNDSSCGDDDDNCGDDQDEDSGISTNDKESAAAKKPKHRKKLTTINLFDESDSDDDDSDSYDDDDEGLWNKKPPASQQGKAGRH